MANFLANAPHFDFVKNKSEIYQALIFKRDDISSKFF